MMKHFLIYLFVLCTGFTVAQSTQETKSVKDSVLHESDSGVVFDVVEYMPEYPGGSKELYEYLHSSIHLPIDCMQSEVIGKMYYTFIVEKDGSISNIKLIKSANCTALNNEVLRVLKEMKDWNPGVQSGYKVRVRINIPLIVHVK